MAPIHRDRAQRRRTDPTYWQAAASRRMLMGLDASEPVQAPYNQQVEHRAFLFTERTIQMLGSQGREKVLVQLGTGELADAVVVYTVADLMVLDVEEHAITHDPDERRNVGMARNFYNDITAINHPRRVAKPVATLHTAEAAGQRWGVGQRLSAKFGPENVVLICADQQDRQAHFGSGNLGCRTELLQEFLRAMP